MPHETDESGRATDSKLRRMENELADLAMIFRSHFGDEEQQALVAKEYYVVLDKMHELGWLGTLDIQSQLPQMPDWYYDYNPRRNPFDPNVTYD